MAVTHVTAARNGMANYIVDQLNNGFIEFQTSADSEVATCGFAATAFGSASSGIATAGAITDDADAAGGTIAKAELQTSATTAVVLCSVTVAGGGGDIIISSLAIAPGETVSVTSLTYAAAP